MHEKEQWGTGKERSGKRTGTVRDDGKRAGKCERSEKRAGHCMMGKERETVTL